MRKLLFLLGCIFIRIAAKHIGQEWSPCSTEISPFEYLVSIKLRDIHFCSGILVGSQWILTPLSCWNNMHAWYKNWQWQQGKPDTGTNLNQTDSCFEINDVMMELPYIDCGVAAKIESPLVFGVKQMNNKDNNSINNSNNDENLVLLKSEGNFSSWMDLPGETEIQNYVDWWENFESSRDLLFELLTWIYSSHAEILYPKIVRVQNQKCESGVFYNSFCDHNLKSCQNQTYNDNFCDDYSKNCQNQTDGELDICDINYQKCQQDTFKNHLCGDFTLDQISFHSYSMHTGDPIVFKNGSNSQIVGYFSENYLSKQLKIDKSGLESRRYYYPAGNYDQTNGATFLLFDQDQILWMKLTMSDYSSDQCITPTIQPDEKENKQKNMNLLIIFLCILLPIIVVLTIMLAFKQYYNAKKLRKIEQTRKSQQEEENEDINRLVKHLALQLNQEFKAMQETQSIQNINNNISTLERNINNSDYTQQSMPSDAYSQNLNQESKLMQKSQCMDSNIKNNDSSNGSMQQPVVSYSDQNKDFIVIQDKKQSITYNNNIININSIESKLKTMGSNRDSSNVSNSDMLSFGEQTQLELCSEQQQQQSVECPCLPNDSAFNFNVLERLKLPRNIPQINFNLELSNLQLIGAGGFASVFTAQYKNKQVAVKIVTAVFGGEQQLRAILEEMDNMSKLEIHPNIVTFIGAALAPQPSIIMEYVPFGTLQGYLEGEHAVGYENVLKIAYGIAKGLQYLHSLGLIHRDLKPQNVLIMDREQLWVKIADFGLSRINLEAMSTVTQTFAGTPHYMAPEAFRNKRISGAVDIWALGCIIQQMLRGVKPWKDCDKAFITHQVANRRLPPDFGILPNNCTKGLKRLVQRCWCADAGRRPSADQVVQKLKQLMGQKQNDFVSRIFSSWLPPLFKIHNRSYSELQLQQFPSGQWPLV